MKIFQSLPASEDSEKRSSSLPACTCAIPYLKNLDCEFLLNVFFCGRKHRPERAAPMGQHFDVAWKQALSAGAVAFLSKPFQEASLVESLELAMKLKVNQWNGKERALRRASLIRRETKVSLLTVQAIASDMAAAFERVERVRSERGEAIPPAMSRPKIRPAEGVGGLHWRRGQVVFGDQRRTSSGTHA
jgi:hypothetical protein